jgi:Uncharacterized protein involved in chromosome partitioning
MNIRNYIKKIVLFTVALLFVTGCSSKLKSENNALKDENKQMKQQLDNANEKLKAQNELYELRNILDSQTHEILSELSKGNTSYAGDKTTANITVSGNKVVSNSKTGGIKVELELPKEQFNLRQRAYTISDDKKEFNSIYEILPIQESQVLKTLNVRFVLENGKWKLDYMGRDE